METKEIIFSLNRCGSLMGCNSECKYHKRYEPSYCRSKLLKDAADRLKELETENENKDAHILKLCDNIKALENVIDENNKYFAEHSCKWNIFEYETEVTSNMEIIYLTQDEFPRLVVVTNENGKATHWMRLDPPKPKVPTFKDVFLEKFPKAAIENVIKINCIEFFFPQFNVDTVDCEKARCSTCWNQSYFEPEEEGEQK